MRSVVDYYVKYGSTVNICSIDLSKAFDKMDHHALFIQLMRRNIIPVIFLKLLETWFELGVTCVKWGSYFSDFVKLSCGIRQGGVLSPYLFAVFIDSIVDKIKVSGLGCYIRHICFSVLLYADDIILLAPSVSALQKLYQFVNQNCSGWIWLLIRKNPVAYVLILVIRSPVIILLILTK